MSEGKLVVPQYNRKVRFRRFLFLVPLWFLGLPAIGLSHPLAIVAFPGPIWLIWGHVLGSCVPARGAWNLRRQENGCFGQGGFRWVQRHGQEDNEIKLFFGVGRAGGLSFSGGGGVVREKENHYPLYIRHSESHSQKCTPFATTPSKKSLVLVRSGPGKPNQRKVSSWTFHRGIPEQKFNVNRACCLRKNTRIHREMGEIHELFVLALSLVWFSGVTLVLVLSNLKIAESGLERVQKVFWPAGDMVSQDSNSLLYHCNPVHQCNPLLCTS